MSERARHGPRISWFVWAVGAGVYALAVFHRTSLGVAGPLAEDRFSISAAQLSTFVMLQLTVYAAMQVPTGILVDRFGPRRVLTVATITMGVAQLAFALVTSYPLALMARGLLGCGDAMTYIAVLRLAAAWFPARRYALLTALTGLTGTLGNLVATLPLTLMLEGVGWSTTFVIAGSLSVGYAALLFRPATQDQADKGGRVPRETPAAGRQILREVREAWRLPSGRLGFWSHLTTLAGPQAFSILWGYPYLVEGLGYAPTTASSLLLVYVVVGSVTNLSVGLVMSRHGVIRVPVMLGAASACLVGWLVLIAWPGGHVPRALVVIVVIAFAIGGPVSIIAFLIARDYSPGHRISTATGMVNVGGHFGTVIAVYGIGQIVDVVDGDVAVRSLAAFRWGFLAVAALTAFGISRMLVWWLRTRAFVLRAQARGERVPVPIEPWGGERRRALLGAADTAALAATEEREPTS